MKNLSLKISLIIFSYIILIVLIVLSYISIVPEENIDCTREQITINKKIENKFGTEKDTVYKILEKPKSKTLKILLRESYLKRKK